MSGTNKLEHISIEISKSEEQREKSSKENEQHLRGLWDTTKCINLCIMGVPEREERGRKSI